MAGYDQGPDSPVDTLLPLIPQLERSGDTAVSPAGAVGRYQITPQTAAQYNLDPNRLSDPTYAKAGARTILSDYGKPYNYEPLATLVAYNAGPKRAQEFVQSGYDPTVLPAETQDYLLRAMPMLYPNGLPQAPVGLAQQPGPVAPPAAALPPGTQMSDGPPPDVLALMHPGATAAPQVAHADQPPPDVLAQLHPSGAPKKLQAQTQATPSPSFMSFLQNLMGGTALPNPKAPQDTWAQQGAKFVENIPAMFEHTAGGVLQSLGHMTTPSPAITLAPGEEEQFTSNLPTPEQWEKVPGTPGHTGAVMSAEAAKKLKENAPNVPGASWQGFAQNVGQAGVQMAPGLAASALARSPAPFILEASASAYGDAYADARQAGLSHQQADAQATVDAAATALSFKAMEFMPFKHAVGTVTNEITGEVANVYKRTFGDMIKNLTAQGLAVQPAISVTSHVLDNLATGRPPAEGLPGPLLQTGIINTIMMGVGHLAGGNRAFMGEFKTPAGPYAYDPSAEPGRGQTGEGGAGPPPSPPSGLPRGRGPSGAPPADVLPPTPALEAYAGPHATPPADQPTHGLGQTRPPVEQNPPVGAARSDALDQWFGPLSDLKSAPPTRYSKPPEFRRSGTGSRPGTADN